MNAARSALRAATASDHERVDRLFSEFDLSSGGGYAAFLAAQAAAHIPVEDALGRAGAGALLDDWPLRERAGLLRADLAALGVPVPPPLEAPSFPTAAAVWGGLYVLEGSRLGGALLARSLAPGAPASFLGSPGRPGAWRKLLLKLDECLCASEEVEAAASAAQRVFGLFERAGRQVLERAQS